MNDKIKFYNIYTYMYIKNKKLIGKKHKTITKIKFIIKYIIKYINNTIKPL